MSDKTILDYRDKVNKFFWWWKDCTNYYHDIGAHPKCVTTAQATEFVVYLREHHPDRWGIVKPTNNKCGKDLSPASIASYGRTVKTFFNWLEQRGYVEHTPFNRAASFSTRKQNKVIKTVSELELEKLFNELTKPERLDTFTGRRDLAIISMLVDTGIRRGELLSIKRGDLDLDHNRAIVEGKTDRRVVSFSDLCRVALTQYLAEKVLSDLPDNYALWVTDEMLPLGYAGFGSLIRRLEAATGVDFHAHKLRHTFATTMAQQKVSLIDLKELMGHSSITTTEMYIHRNDNYLSGVQAANSPLRRLNDKGVVSIAKKGRPVKHRR